jgi:hypothetical protein
LVVYNFYFLKIANRPNGLFVTGSQQLDPSLGDRDHFYLYDHIALAGRARDAWFAAQANFAQRS